MILFFSIKFRQYLKAFAKEYYYMKTRKWREKGEKERERAEGMRETGTHTERHIPDLINKRDILARLKLLFLLLRLNREFQVSFFLCFRYL